MKKVILFSLLALLSVGTNAATKTKKKSAKKATAAKVDTVDVKTFSYLIGRLNTQGLKEYLVQQKGVDTTYMAQFLQGFQAAELTDADKQVKARITGTEINEDVTKRVIPNISRQMNDSVDLLNRDEFKKGFYEALSGTPCAISNDSARVIVEKQMKYYHEQQMERKYGANRAKGEAFLAANLKKDSIQHTASGLQYKVITMGTGEKPTASQKVKVNYEGRLIDGTVFDSSYKRKQPATFGVNQVIKGWTEALQLMPVGSKWELYIPQQLAYGDREQQKIPPYSCLIFTVELVDIVK